MPSARCTHARANMIRFISLIQAGFLCITISCAFPQSQARHFRCYAIENLRSARLGGGSVRTKKSQMMVTVVPLTPIGTAPRLNMLSSHPYLLAPQKSTPPKRRDNSASQHEYDFLWFANSKENPLSQEKSF